MGKATHRTRRQLSPHSLISRHSMCPLQHEEDAEEEVEEGAEETPSQWLNIPHRVCGSRLKSDTPQSSSVDGSAANLSRLRGASSSWPPPLGSHLSARSPSWA